MINENDSWEVWLGKLASFNGQPHSVITSVVPLPKNKCKSESTRRTTDVDAVRLLMQRFPSWTLQHVVLDDWSFAQTESLANSFHHLPTHFTTPIQTSCQPPSPNSDPINMGTATLSTSSAATTSSTSSSTPTLPAATVHLATVAPITMSYFELRHHLLCQWCTIIGYSCFGAIPDGVNDAPAASSSISERKVLQPISCPACARYLQFGPRAVFADHLMGTHCPISTMMVSLSRAELNRRLQQRSQARQLQQKNDQSNRLKTSKFHQNCQEKASDGRMTPVTQCHLALGAHLLQCLHPNPSTNSTPASTPATVRKLPAGVTRIVANYKASRYEPHRRCVDCHAPVGSLEDCARIAGLKMVNQNNVHGNRFCVSCALYWTLDRHLNLDAQDSWVG